MCNKADERIYVQSALTIPTTEKRQQEERPLVAVQDSFRKVIITADNVVRHRDDQGILIVNLQDFLINPNALEVTP